MALKWNEVVKKPEYQKLSDKEKDEARKEYFNDVIVPQVKQDEINDVWKEFNTDATNTEIDYEIEQLESKVKPAPDWSTKMARSFGIGVESKEQAQQFNEEQKLRERLEFLKERRAVNNPETAFEKYKSAALRGVQDSTIGKAVETYMMDGVNPTAITYEPQGIDESIVSGVAGIGADLPLYALGSGITTGGAIAKSAGAFALPKGIEATINTRREKGSVGLEYYPEILKEAAIGGAEGAAFGVAGKAGEFLQGAIKSPVKGFLAKQAADTALESGVMLGSAGLQGQDITGKTLGETVGTVLAMKLIHANPYMIRELRNKSRETGIPEERLAGNIDAGMAERIRSVEEAKLATDNAHLLTEKQIKQEETNRVQDVIVDKQIRMNYKDGKTPEEIIQVNQIPKEAFPHVADIVDGTVVIKPEMYQKVNDIVTGKNSILAQKYEDILPSQMRDMIQRERQQLIDTHAQAKGELEKAQAYTQIFSEYEPRLREKIETEEIAKQIGDYRRFENIGQIRDKMDEVIDYTMSVTTPEEKVNIISEPSRLMDYINTVESGYSSLKKLYQEAVKKEIVAKMKTLYPPLEIINKAVKVADKKIQAEAKIYQDELIKAQNKLQSIEQHPEYIKHLNREAELAKSQQSPYAVKKEIVEKMEDVKAGIEELKQQQLTDYQRAMGVSSEYGDRAISGKEVYGNHYTNLVEWMKKPVKDITAIFEKADYLDVKTNAKAGLANKTRVIKKLGEKAFREVNDPIKEAEFTAITEIGMYKKRYGQFKEDFKARKEDWLQCGDYMLGLEMDALPALNRMGIKPPKWDDLSAGQQALVNDMQATFKLMFDRVNASRRIAGLEPIREVGHYYTLIRKFGFLEKMGWNPVTITNEAFENIKITDVKTKAFSFAYGKERTYSERAVERDPFQVMDKYLYAALKTIHLTPVISKLRKAVNNENFHLKNPNAVEYLNMTLDYVSGKHISEAKDITNYAANFLHRNMTGAVLAWNVHTMAVQPSSAFIAAQEIGPKYIAQGIKDLTNDTMRKFCEQESKEIRTRLYDASMDEVKKGVTGWAANAQIKGIELGMVPTKYMDSFAAQSVWLGGYRYAKDMLNLNHRGCVTYADDLVVRTQGSASRLDLAPIQHTPLGKLFTTFQTFGINQFNYIKDEVLGASKTNKLVAEEITESQRMERFNSEKYIRKPLGQDKNKEMLYNIYEPKYDMTHIDRLKNMAKFAVIAGGINTVYELLDGAKDQIEVDNTNIGKMISLKPPLPSPGTALSEAVLGQSWVDMLYGVAPTKKEVQLIDGFINVAGEVAMIFPVAGSSLKYGGSNVGGAFAGLLVDTMNTISGQPGAKDWEYVLPKWAGIPGGTQAYRILRQLQKERIQEHKDQRKAADPIGAMKREMYKNSPFRKQTERYKDPGLIEGLLE